jgi:hypothetical protein
LADLHKAFAIVAKGLKELKATAQAPETEMAEGSVVRCSATTREALPVRGWKIGPTEWSQDDLGWKLVPRQFEEMLRKFHIGSPLAGI